MKKIFILLMLMLVVFLFFWGCNTQSELVSISYSETLSDSPTPVPTLTLEVMMPDSIPVAPPEITPIPTLRPNDDTYGIDLDNVNFKHIDMQITDEYFLQDIDNIYENLPNYVGKVVSGQGYLLYLDENGEYFAFVRDYICCGPDAYPMGIACEYSGKIPKEGTWVEIVGVVGSEKGDFYDTPILILHKLKKTKERSGQRVVDY